MNPVVALPRRWWDARSVAFRKVTRTLVLLLLTGAVSLLVGLSTATASSPVGPHEAEWSTTLNSRLTLDLGPLGTISHASPAGPFGVDVVIGEIPGEFSSSQVDTDSLGQALSADGSSYLTLISRPELTVQAGVHSLIADGLRRAGLIESVILCLVAAGRLATRGRLRDTIRDGLSGTWASPLIGVTAVVTVIGLLVPALRSDTVPGTRLDVLAHTPLAQARLSGRVADVVQAYGDQIVGRLESNRAFYAQVDANLAAAWQASQEVGGVVDVTAASGAVDTAAVREQADAVAARTGAATASPSPSPGASPGATTSPGAPTGPGAVSSAAPGASPGATPQESATPALPTGAQAVAEYGRTTAVLTTDLHCNLDMIALAGRLDALSGARLHLDDGDLTMTGSSPEQVCVDALTDAIPSGVERVATIGNHDSEATAHQLRARGWTVTDGTVQSAAGLRILGDVDAEIPVPAVIRAGRRPPGAHQLQGRGRRGRRPHPPALHLRAPRLRGLRPAAPGRAPPPGEGHERVAGREHHRHPAHQRRRQGRDLDRAGDSGRLPPRPVLRRERGPARVARRRRPSRRLRHRRGLERRARARVRPGGRLAGRARGHNGAVGRLGHNSGCAARPAASPR